MKLHFAPVAFESLLLDISERTGIRADIIEKDYYVTLLLKEFANKQKEVPAYFKGGTALYKALSSIRRFSEDIDLTVSVEGCSNSQAKRRLERVSKEYSCLSRNKEDQDNDNRKGSITSVYNYNSVVDIDNKDALQRFGRVKVEATSFTVSEPFEPMLIAPILFDMATIEQKKTLTDIYEVGAFSIATIKLERIFVDKMFAAEFYYLRENYFDVAKHLYDLVVLLQNEKIKVMLSDKALLNKMVNFKRKEEQLRIGSELADKPIHQFSYLRTGINNEELIKEFARMQEIYVFNSEHMIAVDELQKSIMLLFVIVERILRS
ncbi:MAG: nucleotidyl transferase AbiEii/AbiGii toxin family protein [Peptococcia bacterium]|jgi:predicted nucleotidyltransferase component of viral defense system